MNDGLDECTSQRVSFVRPSIEQNDCIILVPREPVSEEPDDRGLTRSPAPFESNGFSTNLGRLDHAGYRIGNPLMWARVITRCEFVT